MQCLCRIGDVPFVEASETCLPVALTVGSFAV